MEYQEPVHWTGNRGGGGIESHTKGLTYLWTRQEVKTEIPVITDGIDSAGIGCPLSVRKTD